MAKFKKVDVIALVVMGVMLVALIMSIVGVCINWTNTTSTELITDKVSVEGTTLAKWGELNGKAEEGIEGYGAMAAFAYITMALVAVDLIVYVVSKFVDLKILKWVVVGISALLLISAIVAISLAYSFTNGAEVDLGIANSVTKPAAGPWLLFIFSVIGAGAGAFGALKK